MITNKLSVLVLILTAMPLEPAGVWNKIRSGATRVINGVIHNPVPLVFPQTLVFGARGVIANPLPGLLPVIDLPGVIRQAEHVAPGLGIALKEAKSLVVDVTLPVVGNSDLLGSAREAFNKHQQELKACAARITSELNKAGKDVGSELRKIVVQVACQLRIEGERSALWVWAREMSILRKELGNISDTAKFATEALDDLRDGRFGNAAQRLSSMAISCSKALTQENFFDSKDLKKQGRAAYGEVIATQHSACQALLEIHNGRFGDATKHMGESMERAGATVRMVDPETGTLLQNAGHTLKTEAPIYEEAFRDLKARRWNRLANDIVQAESKPYLEVVDAARANTTLLLKSLKEGDFESGLIQASSLALMVMGSVDPDSPIPNVDKNYSWVKNYGERLEQLNQVFKAAQSKNPEELQRIAFEMALEYHGASNLAESLRFHVRNPDAIPRDILGSLRDSAELYDKILEAKKLHTTPRGNGW